MPRTARGVLALTAILLTAAGPGCGASVARGPSHSTDVPQRPPRLVVLVVYDQLGSWVLETHQEHLAPEGAIRWMEARGLWVERARYPYAGTFTAPGHTAIVSGVGPSESGVSSNRVWDRARRARVSSFDDGTHLVVGRTDAYAGLATLHTRTVADVLVETSPSSRVVSLGMKDRSALPMGGHTPTVALWFDALAGGFTTSSELRAELPPWMPDFRVAHPWESYRRPWEPLRTYEELGPDAAPGEGSYGLDSSFPHDATGLTDIDAFLSLPSSNELLLALAERSITEEHLGEDDVVDFLAVSIAGTDYVGHGFGPESWEARDHLIRGERLVGRFLEALARRTELAVLLTADHGVAPLPERARLHDLPSTAGRWSAVEELPLLRAQLDSALGPRDGGWVDGWVVPYVFLVEDVRNDPALRARALDATRAHLRTRPGMGFVFDRLEAARLRESADEVERAIGLSIADDAPGDIYVLPSAGNIADDVPGSTGTGHGSPFDYDRDVPVLVVGPGVTRGRTTSTVAQGRVAATLAHLLGIAPPHAGHTPLLSPE